MNSQADAAERLAPPMETRVGGAVRRISFVGPIVTILIAGLTKLIKWDLDAAGYGLLAAYVLLGFLLECIPQRVRLWDVGPSSSEATLKQTVGTMRVLVAIVLVLFPVGILATNKTWLAKVPEGFDAYVTRVTDAEGKSAEVLYVSNQPLIPKDLYVGRLDHVADKAVTESGQVGTAAPSVPPGTKLYVMATKRVISGIADNVVVPTFYLLGLFAWIIAALFVFAIFLIENLGDMLWKERNKRVAG